MFCRRGETEKQTALQSWHDPPAMGVEATGWPEGLRSVLCPGFHLGAPVEACGDASVDTPTVRPPPSGLSQEWCP